jgi:hypothetical protein
VRSKLWEAADPSKPVYFRMMSAYHQCCNEISSIELGGVPGAKVEHDWPYGTAARSNNLWPVKLSACTQASASCQVH